MYIPCNCEFFHSNSREFPKNTVKIENIEIQESSRNSFSFKQKNDPRNFILFSDKLMENAGYSREFATKNLRLPCMYII